MGLPAILAAAKPFAGAIASGVNAISSFFTNKANKNTALEMYDRQRADALADWNRQNEYNSPSAQMQRYKDAGLSPHLIYGQTNTAPAVRSSTLDTPKALAPQFDQQTLFAPLQMELMKEQINLTKANAMKSASETDWKNLNTKFFNETYGNRKDIMQWNTDLKADQIMKQQEEIRRIVADTKNILARTNLSEEQKSLVSQTISNARTTNQILGYKVDSAKYEAEFMNKIRSMGIIGSTAAQLLKLAFGK